MSSIFGNNIRVSLFGQSHSEAIGVVIDGLPAGHALNIEEIRHFMKRRAPGHSAVSTPRREEDEPEILSGLVDSTTCGAPLCAVIRNTNIRSSDYNALKDIPRPAHADFPAFVKHHGYNDVRGGGHFSARLTAPLCFAGAVCVQLLKEQGISVGAHIASIGSVYDALFDAASVSAVEIDSLHEKPFPLLNQDIWNLMEQSILDARKNEDSLGGVVECAITGLPAGLGEPLFDGVENRIAVALFAVPAVKGLEFGAGFAASTMYGSQNNDPFYCTADGGIRTRTNNHGGILGGLTSGMPVVFRAAFKPTPSIARAQDSVSLSTNESRELHIEGRHDPCVVPRAVPCVEAAAAIAIYDILAGAAAV